MALACKGAMSNEVSVPFLKAMFAFSGALLAIGVLGLVFAAVTTAPTAFVGAIATTSGVWTLSLTYVAWCDRKALAAAKAEAETLKQRVAELETRIAQLAHA